MVSGAAHGLGAAPRPRFRRGVGATTAPQSLVLVNGVWTPTNPNAPPPVSGVVPGQPYLLTANQYLQSTAASIAAAQEACDSGDTAACGQAANPAAIMATNLAQYCSAGPNSSPECQNPTTAQATIAALTKPMVSYGTPAAATPPTGGSEPAGGGTFTRTVARAAPPPVYVAPAPASSGAATPALTAAAAVLAPPPAASSFLSSTVAIGSLNLPVWLLAAAAVGGVFFLMKKGGR